MSETWKGSGRQSTNRLVLKVAVNADGTYQIEVNDEVAGKCIPGKWLDDELCGKLGCCGEELAEISANFATPVRPSLPCNVRPQLVRLLINLYITH